MQFIDFIGNLQVICIRLITWDLWWIIGLTFMFSARDHLTTSDVYICHGFYRCKPCPLMHFQVDHYLHPCHHSALCWHGCTWSTFWNALPWHKMSQSLWSQVRFWPSMPNKSIAMNANASCASRDSKTKKETAQQLQLRNYHMAQN